MAKRFGGSFAPPLTDELLTSYKSLIATQPESAIKDALKVLHNCCSQWWAAPESTGEGRPHPSGRGLIVDLDKPIADALWDHIPWTAELDMFQKQFDSIEPGDLRNAAFHLLWHAKELDLDREPLTNDKL